MKPTILFLLIGNLCLAQNVAFGDSNFKSAILNQYPSVDSNGDGEISYAEALSLTSIRNLSTYPAITSAVGVEAFTNLTELNLKQQSLSTIDLSQNINLTTLNLRENNLSETLNLSSQTVLSNLELNDNEISNIVLPSTGTLSILYLNDNPLTSIDLSNQTGLKRLYLVNNPISSLEVSNNVLLEKINLDGMLLTSLDLSGLTKLNWLSLNNNHLSSILFSNNPLLKTILAQNNQLTEFNFMDSYSNALTLINISGNTSFNQIKKDCSDSLPTMADGINIIDNCNMGVEDLPTKKQVLLYPNPFTDRLHIAGSGVTSIKIYDATGKLLLERKINSDAQLYLPNLEKGIYYAKIQTENGELSYTLLKK